MRDPGTEPGRPEGRNLICRPTPTPLAPTKHLDIDQVVG